jgi:hypothetical protein
VAAPEYVPIDPTEIPRVYTSPPRLDEAWVADRPGDVVHGGQPSGPLLGNQGPDTGYVLKLARRFDDRLVLAPGEHAADVVAGCVQVAAKRASSFGRAPVIGDLEMAFTVWGFLSEAPDDLVEFRKPLFAEIHHPHHYAERRRIADMVPEEVLRRPLSRIATTMGQGWQRILSPGARA